MTKLFFIIWLFTCSLSKSINSQVIFKGYLIENGRAKLSFDFLYYGGDMKTVIGFSECLIDSCENLPLSNVKYGFFYTGNSVSPVVNGEIGLIGSYQSGDSFEIQFIENKVLFRRNGRIIKNVRIEENYNLMLCQFDLISKTKNYLYSNIKLK